MCSASEDVGVACRQDCEKVKQQGPSSHPCLQLLSHEAVVLYGHLELGHLHLAHH
jgi:hypothetical protein